MNKKIGVLIIVIAVIAIAGFYLTRNEPGEEIAIDEQVKAAAAWIEIIAPKVFALIEPETELKTGDELSAGTTIKTDETGLAVIHFPDGSLARLDSETTLTIEQSDFDQTDKTLMVKLTLALGRVWSKVIGLATPASSWEVKTSNAVATVRGTAFGVERLVASSRILSAEDEVNIQALDPATGQPILSATTTISENKFILINDKDSEALKAGTKKLQVKTVTPEMLREDWVSRSLDTPVVDTPVSETSKTAPANLPLPQSLEVKTAQPLNNVSEGDQIIFEAGTKKLQVKTITAEMLKENWISRSLEADKKLEEKPENQTEAETQTEPTQPAEKVDTSVLPLPQSLEVKTVQSLGNVSEGDQIIFEAVLIYNDGSRKVVTGQVKWQVLGLIGSISSAGKFSAKLDPQVAELGGSSGSVVAVWENPPLLAKTPVFEVKTRQASPSGTEG